MSKANLVKLISAILCVAIIVATICIVLFVKDNNVKPALVYDTESGAKLDTDSVQHMPKGLTFVSNAETFSATSVSLTATVLPTTAVNKELDWSIAWAEPDGWTSGKTVTDYIDFSSNDNVATVTFKKLFNVKAVITAISRDNPEVKASCNVDCAKRLLSTRMSMNSAGLVEWNFNSNTPVLPLLNEAYLVPGVWSSLRSGAVVTYDYQYSDGTTNNEVVSTDVKIKTSSALKSSVSGYTRFDAECGLGANVFPYFSYGVIIEGLCGYTRETNDFSLTKFRMLVSALGKVETEDFILTVTVNMKYGEPLTTVFKCRLDRTTGPFAVSEVNFDNGSLVL